MVCIDRYRGRGVSYCLLPLHYTSGSTTIKRYGAMQYQQLQQTHKWHKIINFCINERNVRYTLIHLMTQTRNSCNISHHSSFLLYVGLKKLHPNPRSTYCLFHIYRRNWRDAIKYVALFSVCDNSQAIFELCQAWNSGKIPLQKHGVLKIIAGVNVMERVQISGCFSRLKFWGNVVWLIWEFRTFLNASHKLNRWGSSQNHQRTPTKGN